MKQPAGSPSSIMLAWLLRLRWVAAAAQFVAILAVIGLGLPARLWVNLGVALLTGATNAWLAFRRGEPSRELIFGVLALDTALLTLILSTSGGASNPFTILYIVHIALAAVVLGPRQAAWLGALALAGYALLFWAEPSSPAETARTINCPSCVGEEPEAPLDFSLHLYGMWLSLGLSAGAIAYFVARLSSALSTREAELASYREREARIEKLAALSTLAAGAAHELSTPLGTIAISAKELELSAESVSPALLREEAQLIRAEVLRCREIINRLRGHAGESAGEAPVRLTSRQALDALVAALGGKSSARVVTLPPVEEVSFWAPPHALVQALVNLTNNGLDASTGIVTVSSAAEEGRILFTVRDEGEGMSPELLARAGEPFVTTKAPGHGMGLGLFLTKSLAAQLGGELALRSAPGQGTTATLSLPRERT